MSDEDTRIVCGAMCLWWGSIDDIGRTEPLPPEGNTLPACPHCGGLLYEFRDEDHWNEVVEAYAKQFVDPDVEYRDLVAWARGKCFKERTEMLAAYKADRKRHAN